MPGGSSTPPNPRANIGAWRPESRGDPVTHALKGLQEPDCHPPAPYPQELGEGPGESRPGVLKD